MKTIWWLSAMAALAAQPVAAAELPPELSAQVMAGETAARACFQPGQQTAQMMACVKDASGHGTAENPHSALFGLGASFFLSFAFDAMYQVGLNQGHSKDELEPFRKVAVAEYTIWSGLATAGQLSDDDLGKALATDADHRDSAIAEVKKVRAELERLKGEGPAL